MSYQVVWASWEVSCDPFRRSWQYHSCCSPLPAYGPGVVAPLHHHPVEGVGYVVSGRFESAFGGEQPVVVSEGQSFVDRAVVAHTLFRNPDPSKGLKFVIGYVVRKAWDRGL